MVRNIYFREKENEMPHILFDRIGWEFNEDDWEILKDISRVHKLSYKQRIT